MKKAQELRVAAAKAKGRLGGIKTKKEKKGEWPRKKGEWPRKKGEWPRKQKKGNA